jgi:hypothetical protein
MESKIQNNRFYFNTVTIQEINLLNSHYNFEKLPKYIIIIKVYVLISDKNYLFISNHLMGVFEKIISIDQFGAFF